MEHLITPIAYFHVTMKTNALNKMPDFGSEK